MAENQTATEDSGQSQQHQQQQQNQQPQSPQQEQQPPALSSPTSPSQEDSASSPDDSQTIAIPNTNHHPNHQSQMQEQTQSRSLIDRQISSKFKTAATQRRNTIQAPVRAVSTTAIKKPPSTKMPSMSGSLVTGGGPVGSTVLNADSKHHPQHHHYHNSTSNHHHSSSTSASAAIQRTTSESLRLNALPGGSAGESSSTSNLSNATSNSSLNSHLSNSTGSGTSVAPQSTTTTASTSKATSPNNNNTSGGGGVGAGSLASRSHHSHSSHHHSHSSHHPHHGQVSSQPSRKPKTSSFQITSVTVGQAKLSSDNGDESADDLDESHTDDNSRITDVENETPSVSEDTFSKEEVYFSNNALSTTAPVIPTSSQYGLVVVDPIGPNLGQTLQNVQVNVSDNIINVVSAGIPGEDGKKKDDGKDTQHRSERFKVVKIESTEPFKRGRWMCMDYLDHSAVGTGGKDNNDKTVSSESGSGGSGEPSKTTQSMIIGPGAACLLENHVDAVGNSLQLTGNVGANEGNWNFSETSTNQQPGNVPSGVATAPATVVHGMQQFITGDGGQQQQQAYSDNGNANASGDAVHGQTMPMDYAAAAAQQLQQSLQELKKQEEAIAAETNSSSGSVYAPEQSQPINFAAQQLPQQQSMSQQQPQHQPQQQQQQHAATLPSNLHFKNGANNSVSTDTPSNNNNGQETVEQNEEQPQQQQTTQQQQPAMQPLSMSYVAVESQQQSQPLSPAPHSAQTEAPSFVPTDGTAYNQQNFQQTPQQQPPQIIPSDAIHLQTQETQQHSQTQQQQQQQQHSPPQLKQQISQTDGVAAPIQQQQQSSQQQFHQQTAAGQTLPILSQIPSYEMKAGQTAASTSIAAAAPTPTATLAQTLQHQQQQGAPATIADPTAINATLPAQQPAVEAAISPNPNAPDTENATLKTIAPITTGTNAPNEQQNNASVSGNSSHNNNNANSNNNILSNVAAAAAVATNSTTSTGVDEQLQQQLQPQLQSNTETETERTSRLSRNLIASGSNRKRAFSTPHISPAISNFLNTNNANFATLSPNQISSSDGNTTDSSPQLYYTHTASGRVSFCVDDSQWPNTQGRSAGSNIFTNLALGDERFRLPLNTTAASNSTTRESSLGLSEEFQDATEAAVERDNVNENFDENDEYVDQFSPTIYAANLSRSVPIPISAGNSPQHMAAPTGSGGGLQTPQLMSPTRHAVAFNASPTTGAHLYSPFYCGSPEALASAPQMGALDGSDIGFDTTKLSFSYDPALSAAIQRLPLPNSSRQHSQRTSPVEEGCTSPAVTATALVFPVYSSASASATVSPTNSASGTSAVAIDNKIEQAMDLVKSHLMIAVREEVEVLKEKISELMDKINQLEVENTILKANMSQETLQQLQMQTQLQIAGNGTPAGSNMIAAAPAPPTATQQQQQQQQTNAANTNATVVAAAAATTNATPATATAAATAPANDTAAAAATVVAAAGGNTVTTTNGPMS